MERNQVLEVASKVYAICSTEERKREQKQRHKQVQFIQKQLMQLKDVEAEFARRKSIAVADAEAPQLVVEQYKEHGLFVESLVSIELRKVLERLEWQLQSGRDD